MERFVCDWSSKHHSFELICFIITKWYYQLSTWPCRYFWMPSTVNLEPYTFICEPQDTNNKILLSSWILRIPHNFQHFHEFSHLKRRFSWRVKFQTVCPNPSKLFKVYSCDHSNTVGFIGRPIWSPKQLFVSSTRPQSNLSVHSHELSGSIKIFKNMM